MARTAYKVNKWSVRGSNPSPSCNNALSYQPSYAYGSESTIVKEAKDVTFVLKKIDVITYSLKLFSGFIAYILVEECVSFFYHFIYLYLLLHEFLF